MTIPQRIEDISHAGFASDLFTPDVKQTPVGMSRREFVEIAQEAAVDPGVLADGTFRTTGDESLVKGLPAGVGRAGDAELRAIPAPPGRAGVTGPSAAPPRTAVTGSRHLATHNWSNVQPEFRIGQALHAVDIYGRSPAGIPTAFEITLSMSNVVSNALKTLAVPGGVQELIFLCPVIKECKVVERMLQQDARLASYLPRIRVCRVDQFIS